LAQTDTAPNADSSSIMTTLDFLMMPCMLLFGMITKTLGPPKLTGTRSKRPRSKRPRLTLTLLEFPLVSKPVLYYWRLITAMMRLEELLRDMEPQLSIQLPWIGPSVLDDPDDTNLPQNR